MAKPASNFKFMVLTLLVITLIASAAVGGVYILTQDPIAASAQKKQTEAIKAVLPTFEKLGQEYSLKPSDSEEPLLCFPALNKDGNVEAIAVKAYTNKGFSGHISFMIGYKTDGSITGFSVLQTAETPGLGSKIPTWFGKDGKGDVIGMNPKKDNMTVSKDGGDVDAITAATISSRAFLDAVSC